MAGFAAPEPVTDLAAAIGEAVSALTFADLSPAAVDNARRGLVDTLGVCAAATGAARDELAPVRRMVERQTGGELPAFVHGWPLSLMDASFWMGSLGHALDYDDIHDIAVVHPSAPILAAIVPFTLERHAAGIDVSGQTLLTALAAGQDVAVRLGTALRRSITEYGWLPSVPGAVAAAVGAAKLLGLSPTGIRDAIALAVHQTAGTMQAAAGMGSTYRAIRDGFNARAGLTAALLAQAGCPGDAQILEGEFGYFAQYFDGDYDRSALLDGLGERWLGETLGLKAWPCCGYSQFYLTALEKLLRANDVDIAEMARIEVVGEGGLLRAQCEPRAERIRPARGIDAKFSLPFQLGKYLAHGTVTLRDFTAAGLADERAHDLAELVGWRVDDTIVTERPGFGPGIVVVHLAGGRTIEARADHAFGSVDNPMSWDSVVTKFTDCLDAADLAIGPGEGKELATRLREIDRLGSCHELLRRFCSGATQ
ncbi:MmgE/PrpD family protein [Amycolatopsis jejuensis]|uniref:MmgE/PrpD family protein n=1 Tax=Amycolatopsis jejuensis TaxID=330084 RepID=UPI000525415F|nr:MmgE/PrpD family protein [Amycolatopsis jejuensis]